jgi:dihydrofolate reductase
MRRLKLFVAVSLDGYLARQDGSVDWLFTDQDYGMRAFFSSVDTVLIGRKTHDFMVAHGMPAYPGIKNCVFTSARNRDNYGGKVEYVGADPAGFVAALKQRPGKDIWLCGGGSLATPLLAARAVDDVLLAIHPRILGEGMPLFASGLPELPLTLASHTVYETGLVALHYVLTAT